MIRSTGSPDADILICGEAPGTQELEQGIPFVGPTGGLLWRVGSRYGLDRADCFVTNVVQSAPATKTGKPSAAQIREERSRLVQELAASKARIVVPVGDIAWKALTGVPRGITLAQGLVYQPKDCQPIQMKVLEQIGFYKTSRKWKYTKGDPRYGLVDRMTTPELPPNCKYIIPMLHPSGVARSGFGQMPALRATLKRVAQASRDEMVLIDEDFPYVEHIPIGVCAQGPVVIDIETSRESDAIERIGFAWVGGCCTVPWGHEAAQLVRWLFTTPPVTSGAPNQPERVLVFHNAAFDMPRLEKAVGMRCEVPIFCTMIGAMMLCPELRKGLEAAAPLYVSVTPWKHLNEINPALYNAKDAVVTLAMFLSMRARMKAEGMLDVWRMVSASLRPVWESQMRGLHIDGRSLEQFKDKIADKIEDVMIEWGVLWPDVLITSHAQLKTLLYEELGLEKQYKDKKLTTEAAAIQILLYKAKDDEDPTVIRTLQLILELRGHQSELRVWGKVDPSERIIYPEYVPKDKDEAEEKEKHRRGSAGQGAATIRFQARHPPVSQLDEDGRYMVLPPPGRRFYYPDWSQAEARVEAEGADDNKLRLAIEAGLHDNNARVIGCDKTRAKNFWYGKGRFAGVTTLVKSMRAEGFHVTAKQMREWGWAVDREYSKWAAWREALVIKAQGCGYVENPFGLRRRFYDKGHAPALVGWYPQSTVSMMFCRVLSKLPPNIMFHIPMHDGMLCSEEPDSGDHELVVALMETPFDEVAPGWRCPVDCKVGLVDESWGAMEARYKAAKARAKGE